MKNRTNLRAVDDLEAEDVPETGAQSGAQSVAEAAASGDHRSLLVAMRERIAQAVSDPGCPPRDLAALTRRLQDVSKEIEAIDLRAKEDGADAADVAEDEKVDPATF